MTQIAPTTSVPRKWAMAGVFAAAATLTLVLVMYITLGLLRPIPANGAAIVSARGGIACPADAAYVDAVRLQAQIDADMNAFAAGYAQLTAAEAKSKFVQMQLATCAFVLQNPRRGMAWVQLLAVTPQAEQDDVLFSQLFQKSFDLGRLQVDAARGRVSLASRRWTKLPAVERQMLLSDARTLILARSTGAPYTLLLAQQGIVGGPELRREYRQIVQENWAETVPIFDAEEAKVLAVKPKA